MVILNNLQLIVRAIKSCFDDTIDLVFWSIAALVVSAIVFYFKRDYFIAKLKIFSEKVFDFIFDKIIARNNNQQNDVVGDMNVVVDNVQAAAATVLVPASAQANAPETAPIYPPLQASTPFERRYCRCPVGQCTTCYCATNNLPCTPNCHFGLSNISCIRNQF